MASSIGSKSFRGGGARGKRGGEDKGNNSFASARSRSNLSPLSSFPRSLSKTHHAQQAAHELERLGAGDGLGGRGHGGGRGGGVGGGAHGCGLSCEREAKRVRFSSFFRFVILTVDVRASMSSACFFTSFSSFFFQFRYLFFFLLLLLLPLLSPCSARSPRRPAAPLLLPRSPAATAPRAAPRSPSLPSRDGATPTPTRLPSPSGAFSISFLSPNSDAKP
jgi:hypothetical protein